MKTAFEYLALFIFFFVLGNAYLYPGTIPLFEQSVTEAMSDGTDPVPLAFMYEQVVRVAKNSPLELFYGAVPNTVVDAPEGGAMWMSWIEKFLALFFSSILPSEQIATAVVLILLIFNGLAFYAMARSLSWARPLSLALSLCWAFNSFTHARAKVHMAMVAIYFLPLIFLAFSVLKKRMGNRTLIVAALCFLGASLTLHYFLVLTAFLCPFLIWFYFIDPDVRKDWKKNLLRLSLAALPAILLLLWCLTHPLPEHYLDNNSNVLPKTGEHIGTSDVHPFQIAYAARPIDYLAGDTGVGPKDLNPLRGLITASIHSDLDGSNFHERANGIRWAVLFVVVAVLIFILAPKFRVRIEKANKPYYLFFFVFGGFAFLLSLSPLFFGYPIGPSAWLHSLVPQIRVPSRAGVFVHFSALMIAGFFLNSWLFQKSCKHSTPSLSVLIKKALKYLPSLSLLAILSFPPFLNPLPVSKIQARYSSLTSGDEFCGTGMYFPYVSGNHGVLEYYYFIQRLRGTNCSYINANEPSSRNTLLLRSFPLHSQVIEVLKKNDPNFNQGLKNFVQCTGLQWIVFNNYVPNEWRTQFCNSLGWRMPEPEVCKAPRPHNKLKQTPEQCL